MKVFIAAFCLLAAGATIGSGANVYAQKHDSDSGPSKYLYISNNIVRPGQFAAFYKAEGDAAQAVRDAHAPNRYIAAVPITGTNDVVFFHAFDSFEELQKNHDATQAIPGLMDKLHAISTDEAALLSDEYTSIYEYQPDLSLHTTQKVVDARFLDITIFHVQTGHMHDFENVLKLFVKAQENNPNANYATFQKMYGTDSGDTYILITLLKSLADVDQEVQDGEKLPEIMGKEQFAVNMAFGNETLKSSESHLFALNPKISYVPDSWLTESPGFWGKK
jgi:hypothetical protein